MKRLACRLVVGLLLPTAIAASFTPCGKASAGAGIEELKQLTRSHPDSAQLCAQIASVCFAEGTISGRIKAADYMKQAVRLDPGNADYHVMLAEIYFAGTYWNYGVQELQRAVRIMPGSARARTRLGKAYLDRAIQEWQMTRFKQARQELKRALSIDTQLVGASNLLALCNLDFGRPDSALALLEHLPEDSLNVDALLLLGMARFEKKQVDRASEAFQDALARMDDARRRRYLSRGFWTGDRGAREMREAVGIAAPEADRGAAFLAYVWKRDDPNPATPANERLVEHLARVSFADFHFSVPRLGRPGSETTRGEVYCRYGHPLRWYYDPFGTNTFAGETVSPGNWDSFSGEDPFANLAELYRPKPLRVRKPRWVWLYKDFTLSFEDTHLNGDYTFPYEQDWSAYVDAYLKKNLPAVYESEIRTRMRVALDIANHLDDDGQSSAKVVFACDTRGIAYAPDVRLPSGEFEVEIAFLDSAYGELARASFRAELSADSSSLSATETPLVGSYPARLPGGTAVAAISLRSVDNGALGFAMTEARPRRFGEGLETSDIEIRTAADRPADPSRVFLGCTKIFLAFDIYNVVPDGTGNGNVEVAWQLTAKPEPPPLLKRFLRSLLGRDTAEAGYGVPSVKGKERLSTRGKRVHCSIPVDVTSLVDGEYEIEVEARDVLGADTTTATAGITLSASSE